MESSSPSTKLIFKNLFIENKKDLRIDEVAGGGKQNHKTPREEELLREECVPLESKGEVKKSEEKKRNKKKKNEAIPLGEEEPLRDTKVSPFYHTICVVFNKFQRDELWNEILEIAKTKIKSGGSRDTFYKYGKRFSQIMPYVCAPSSKQSIARANCVELLKRLHYGLQTLFNFQPSTNSSFKHELNQLLKKLRKLYRDFKKEVVPLLKQWCFEETKAVRDMLLELLLTKPFHVDRLFDNKFRIMDQFKNCPEEKDVKVAMERFNESMAKKCVQYLSFQRCDLVTIYKEWQMMLSPLCVVDHDTFINFVRPNGDNLELLLRQLEARRREANRLGNKSDEPHEDFISNLELCCKCFIHQILKLPDGGKILDDVESNLHISGEESWDYFTLMKQIKRE